jgi:hypothetical protein
MKTTLPCSLAGRKRKPALLSALWVASMLFVLSSCASRTKFQQGYDRGSADAVKRQYWMQQNLQKQPTATQPGRLHYYHIPIQPVADAAIKTVPYEITIPIYEP